MKQRSVTVLGMHRSGTSLVTGVLKHLGVDMGESDPPHITWDSPLGQTEDLAFVRLDNAILAAAGGSWDKPPSHEEIMQQKDKFDGRIKELISSKKSPIWGWKTARNCLTIELYLPYLPEPYFIVCSREMDEICRSLMRRNNITRTHAERLTDRYVTDTKDFYVEHHDLHITHVEYGKVSVRKADFVDGLTDFLGLRVTSDMRNRAIESILPHRAIRELSDNMKAMSDIKLDVGCGDAKKDGWIGIDARPLDGVDIVWDLTHFPWPLATECCSVIKMDQVWSMIEPKYRNRLMDELWRVAKIDCQLTLAVPHANTSGADQDPMCYGCPNETTLWYFDPRHPRYSEYNPLPWRIKEQAMAAYNVVVIMEPMKELAD